MGVGHVGIAIFGFAIGTIWGSFLNVIIWRLPRSESWILGRSNCPSCRHVLPWSLLIPIVSFGVLRGRCRFCGERISHRYWMVELIAGAGVVALIYSGLPVLEMVKWAAILSVLLALFVTDLETRLLPNFLTGTLGVLGIGFSVISGTGWQSAIGCAVGAGVMGSVAWIGSRIYRRPVMGGGDIKLVAGLGAVLGWPLVGIGVYLGFLVGAIVAVIGLVIGKLKRRDVIPFGPALIIGALGARVWGDQIIHWFFFR